MRIKYIAVGVIVVLCLSVSGCGGSEPLGPAGYRAKLTQLSDAGATLIQFKDLLTVINLSDKHLFEVVDWSNVSQGLFPSNKLVLSEFAVYYREGEKRTLLCSLGFTREISIQELDRMITEGNDGNVREAIFVGFFGAKE